jgi:hypothetical protein
MHHVRQRGLLKEPHTIQGASIPRLEVAFGDDGLTIICLMVMLLMMMMMLMTIYPPPL